jgi:hypothetical protein
MTRTTTKTERRVGSLSEIHRKNHAATLATATKLREDGAAHARFLEVAKACRFFFGRFRSIGE